MRHGYFSPSTQSATSGWACHGLCARWWCQPRAWCPRPRCLAPDRCRSRQAARPGRPPAATAGWPRRGACRPAPGHPASCACVIMTVVCVLPAHLLAPSTSMALPALFTRHWPRHRQAAWSRRWSRCTITSWSSPPPPLPIHSPFRRLMTQQIHHTISTTRYFTALYCLTSRCESIRIPPPPNLWSLAGHGGDQSHASETFVVTESGQSCC